MTPISELPSLADCALDRVARCANAVQLAQRQRDDALREAVAAGVPRERLAPYVGGVRSTAFRRLARIVGPGIPGGERRSQLSLQNEDDPGRRPGRLNHQGEQDASDDSSAER